jgi:hypothetical protein
MNFSFYTQILISFLAGGILITLISLMAERASEKNAGIIMMIPTTIVLGFLFLALATSAENVSTIVPATLVPIGIIMLSIVIYIRYAILFSEYFKNKPAQITMTLAASSLSWFILAGPFAWYKFNNLALGIAGYFASIFIAGYFLNKAPSIRPEKKTYTPLQITFRAVFVGTILSTVVVLGNKLNVFWGGVFTMYPAATFASLVIFQYYYQPNQLFFFMKKAPLGSLSLFVYAISVMLLYPKLGILGGTILSYMISILFIILLLKFQKQRLVSLKKNQI